MKILFVCHRLPFPPNRGGKIRPFHMIQHLGRNHDVVVASLAHTQAEMDEGAGLKEHCSEVIAEILPSFTRWRQAGLALGSATPSSVAYFSSAKLQKRINAAWQKGGFDAVMVHCAFMGHYVLGLPGAFRILDYGDLDSAKWFDYVGYHKFPMSLGYRIEAQKLRSHEKALAKQFDLCIFTTEGELQEFKSLNVNVPCAVIPNGVDYEHFQPRAELPKDSAVIVFLGRMDYFPNADGVQYFAREIFPLILRAHPHAKLRIVGSNPTRNVRNLANIAGISVTGHVPDVRPYLQDAAVAVAPLRIARGTQNKILQFLSMGIPVVATPEAARGVQAIPGKHLAVAGMPEHFAQRVVAFLGSPQLQRDFADAGRGHLQTVHSWPLSMQVLDDVLERGRERFSVHCMLGGDSKLQETQST